jgi:negative regulator of sigma E activity
VTVIAIALAAGAGRTAQAASAEPADSPTPSPESVLDHALKAARTLEYEATASVTVLGQRGTETGVLHVVRGYNDRLLIQTRPGSGGSGWALMQEGQTRAVMGPQGAYVARGQTSLASALQPDSDLHQLLAKYRVAVEGAVQSLGRAAWLLRIERAADSRLVERWTVDAASGLLLRRESYNDRGQVERLIAFTEVKEPYAPAGQEFQTPPAPTSAQATQRWFGEPDLDRLARSLKLPTTLPDSFRLRSGTSFKAAHASVVQLVYSDGLEEVSLFEVPGKLARGSLPAGARRIKLGHGGGFIWDGFPRGTAWQGGTETFTLVGASPTDELTEMADSLPQAPIRQSLRQRLSHLTDWVRDRLDF